MEPDNQSGNQPEGQSHLFEDLSFDFTAKQHLRSIASWAMVIGVIALIGFAISLYQVFTTPELVRNRSEGFDLNINMQAGGGTKIWTIVSILIRLVLVIFLFRFVSQVRTGLNGLNQSALNSSFNSLKIYFMIAGILALVVILFFLLGIITAVGA